MQITRKLVVLVALLSLVLMAGCGSPSGSGSGNTGSGNAATVNGKAITMADFNKQVDLVRASMSEQGLDPKSKEGQETLDQVQSDILNQLVDMELIRQGAQAQGVTVTDAEVNDRLAQIIADAGGDATFKESVKKIGLTEAEFRSLIVQDQMIYERLFEKVTKSIPATAEQVHARHILVATAKEAEDIKARLAKGGDFAALAKELSLDTESKESGGDLGFFPRGIMDTAFEDAAFKLKVNEIASVQTDFGYHVIQVTERDANHQLAPEILQWLGEEAMYKFIAEQRQAAKIEIIVKLPPTPTPSQ